MTCGRLLHSLFAGLLLVVGAGSSAVCLAADGNDPQPSAGAGPVEVVCRLIDGEPVSGALLRLDERSIVIGLPSGEATFPISRVRTLERVAPTDGRDAAALGVRITLGSGGSLAGADLEVAGPTARVVTGPATIDLPTTAIAAAEFGVEDAGRPAGWLAEAPQAGEAEADLVVVGTEESHEFVECGITGVTKSTVNVVLDGEAIAVKRSKVLGLKWLRPAERSAGAIRLSSTAGSILVGPPRLEGDAILAAVPAVQAGQGQAGANDIRLPAALITRIDYAAGRTTSLVTTDRLQVRVEPLLGSLSAFADVSAAFQPRRIDCREGDRRVEGLRLVPRSTVSWEIPKGSSRLRAIVRPAHGLLGTATGGTRGEAALGSNAAVPEAFATGRLIVSVDGREVLSTVVSGEQAIDLDVSGGRTLTVVCDYPLGSAPRPEGAASGTETEGAADSRDGIAADPAPFGGGVVLVEPRLES